MQAIQTLKNGSNVFVYRINTMLSIGSRVANPKVRNSRLIEGRGGGGRGVGAAKKCMPSNAPYRRNIFRMKTGATSISCSMKSNGF